MSDAPNRIAPQLTPENEFFWTSGADGELRGDGGERQVKGDSQVALVATGGGAPGGCMLLTRA